MHIISLKRTKKEDKLITLWRWRSNEFTFYLSKAGEYESFANSNDCISVDQEMLDKLEKVVAINCFGETLIGIANNTKNRNILGVRYKDNVLVRVKKQ